MSSYETIKIKRLNNDPIKDKDKEKVDNLTDRLKAEVKSNLITAHVTYIAIVAYLIYMYNLSNSTTDLVAAGILGAVYLVTAVYYTRKLKLFNSNNLRNAQYGILQSKYEHLHGRNYRGAGYRITGSTYMCDVKFPETDTEIERARAEVRTYKSLSPGDKVLVLSYDGSTAFCIKVD